MLLISSITGCIYFCNAIICSLTSTHIVTLQSSREKKGPQVIMKNLPTLLKSSTRIQPNNVVFAACRQRLTPLQVTVTLSTLTSHNNFSRLNFLHSSAHISQISSLPMATLHGNVKYISFKWMFYCSIWNFSDKTKNALLNEIYSK